ncbi:MAG: hypothetical protein EOM01_05270, partial [Spirochaetia bacterium]|nr:hypothetical protein [Spirochaetia bacterium]
MNKRGLAHAVFLVLLLVLMSLFLSAFLYTCFSRPAPTSDSLIPLQVPVVTTPVKQPTQGEEPAVPIVRIPGIPVFAGSPSVERELVQPKPLPPLAHLLSFPNLPDPAKRRIEPKEVPRIPAKPVFATEPVSKAYVPEPPYIFEPLVLTEEEYDLFYPAPSQEEPDEDFWADFFVVGQDQNIAFEDGFYYLKLFVNDEVVGDIEVEFLGESRLVNTAELSLYVNPYLTEEAKTRIFGDGAISLTIEQLNERGVEAYYDAIEFSIHLSFSIEDMPERTVSISSSTINRREQYGLSGAIVLKPAKFALASSLSLYALLDYPSDFSALTNKLLSLSVSNRASLLGIG